MSDNLPSKTFCVLPFMSMAATPSGSFRVCCNSDPKKNKIYQPSGQEYKIFREDAMLEAWNSPDYQKIRQQFLDGEKPDMCTRCFREEDAGIRSPRQSYNDKWMRDDIKLEKEIPFDVRYADIRLGNLCNLKCRMCNPWSSSQWVKDWNEVVDTATLEPNKPLTEDNVKWMGELGEWPTWRGMRLNFLELSETVEELYLTGGEPTLATGQYRMFEHCIRKGLAKNIKLKYNTNLTNVPDELIEYWSHFKRVQLNCSIDAVGLRDRYIRYPSNWDKIEENLDKLRAMNNVDIQIHCTAQALNVFAIPELIEWMKSKNMTKDDLYLNILNHPPSLNVRVLPEDMKAQVSALLIDYYDWPKVEDTVNYMLAEDWNEEFWHEFLAYNSKVDILQKMSLTDACPEFKGFV